MDEPSREMAMATPLMATTVPLTPRKQREEDVNLKIRTVVSSFCHEWDLQLVLPRPEDSPSTRLLNPTPAQKCVFRIKALTFKNAIDGVLDEFNARANIMYSGWVHKPKAERGTVPEKTRHRIHPVSDKERLILQNLFCNIADEIMSPIHKQNLSASLSRRHTPHSDSQARSLVDDSPIPNTFLSNSRSPSLKRAAEPTRDESKAFKRPPNPPISSEQTNLPYPPFLAAAGDRTGNHSFAPNTVRSVAPSFMSDVPTVFDQSRHRGSFSTQVTEPNDYLDLSPSKAAIVTQHNNSSQYEGGSSFDAELVLVAESFNSKADVSEGLYPTIVDHELEENGEAQEDLRKAKLREYLEGTFRK